MVVRVGNPAALRDLSDFLRSRTGAIIEQRTAYELEIWPVGCYSWEAMRQRIEVAIGEWKPASQGVRCVVEIDT